MIEERYKMNSTTISEKEMEVIKKSKVCIAGCGGLGGYIIELLARVGIGNLVLVDGDSFNESNLNRQLMSNEKNMGKMKAVESEKRLQLINSQIKTTTICEYIVEKNAEEIIGNSDIVVDALDNIESRLVLEKACGNRNIPLVHGAIGGWYGQVSLVMPGSKILSMIYGDSKGDGEEKKLGNPAFTPANIASIQVAECVKYLLGKPSQLKNAILTVDLLRNDYEVTNL